MNKRYRLLKDLPDGSKNGDVYEQVISTNKYYNTRLYQEAQCIDEGQRWESWQVENNLSWFELIKEEPERSRIVFLPDNTRNALFARHGDKNGENDDKFEYAYVVYSKTLIPEDKHSLIQKAIEEVLNGDQKREWLFGSNYPIGTRVDIDLVEEKEAESCIELIRNLKNEACKNHQFSMASKWREIEKLLVDKFNQQSK